MNPHPHGKKLSDCDEGEIVQIIHVGGHGAFRKRLLEMGFMRGTSISVIRYAPLRDPMEVSVRGTHISLRVEEAAEILVGAAA